MPRGNIVLRMFLLCCAALLIVPPLCADHWPRFRGPNGTGVSADKNVPVAWGAKDGFLWKVALPGRGHSSPIVWGDRLFVQAAPNNGKERLLLCLDVATGKTLWSRSVPGTTAPTHKNNTLASSTPATDGERVYAAFWNGHEMLLAAYDLDGKQIWDHKLGKFESQHGPGASPVVFGGKVFFANDQDDASTLYAFDARTGKILWEKRRPAYRACYSAPFIREKAGAAPELVVVSTMGITGYDPDGGAVNWNWTWKFFEKMPLRTTGSPAYSDGMLFACSGDGGGPRHMIALRLEGAGPQTKATLAWQNRKDFPYVPTPLVRGEHLYFVNDKGWAGCYHAASGKQVWFKRLQGATFSSSPVLIDGKMYAVSEEGEVFVIAAEPTYQLLARNPLGELVRSSPAVADGRLFIRGVNHLYCIGKR
jgi:outer membrane protein assembly factor BamB